jgi:VWFA-related protein
MRDRKMLKYAIDKITLFARPSTFFTPYLAARVLETGFVPGAMTEAMQVAASIMANEEWGGAAPPPSIILGRAKQILEEESIMRRSTLLTIKGVSERMADLPGQRMLAFVSDGFTMLGENGSAEHEDFNDATSRAVRSGVVIYSFSPQGLQAPVEFSARAPMVGVAFGNMMHDSELDQQQTLRDVAHVTGGEAYLNSNDVVGQFKKMLDANRVYYALAYYPQAETDKKFRNIKLRVANHPEYHIRTQSGYQPSNEEVRGSDHAATEAFQAMLAPLPTTAIGVTSAADYLERTGDDNQVTLLVHFDGELLSIPKRIRNFLACELAVVVFDHEKVSRAELSVKRSPQPLRQSNWKRRSTTAIAM